MSVGASELEAPMIAGMLPEAAMNALIDHSVKLPASDLFISSNETHVAVSVRHLGIVRLWTVIPSEMGRRCISYLKVISGMEMAEQRRPLDGRWVRKVEGGGRVDLRIATIPTLYGEDVAIRLLHDGAQSQTVEQLGLPRKDLNTLLAMLGSASGLILVTGPTGSGKTTTLAAMIGYINETKPVHIVTIEDPIEVLHRDAVASINQREIGNDTQDFLSALRAALRQDPDVILIGEMRDTETVRAAIQAAETGHLVLSTLHTVDATETVNRVIDFFPPYQQKQVRLALAGTLRGIICQRLVSTLDGGRTPTLEILVNNGRVAERIVDPDRTAEIKEVIADGAFYGMMTFDQSLLVLLKEGRISTEAAFEAVTSRHDFELAMQQAGLQVPV
jgi:twitching motility protein PilT